MKQNELLNETGKKEFKNPERIDEINQKYKDMEEYYNIAWYIILVICTIVSVLYLLLIHHQTIESYAEEDPALYFISAIIEFFYIIIILKGFDKMVPKSISIIARADQRDGLLDILFYYIILWPVLNITLFAVLSVILFIMSSALFILGIFLYCFIIEELLAIYIFMPYIQAVLVSLLRFFHRKFLKKYN